MLVYGLISPHPPIIIPEIGGAEIENVRQTIQALEQAAKRLAQTRPDTVIIISPHEQHGFEVPLHYLRKQLSPQVEIEKILVTEPSYQYYYEYGQRFAQSIAEDKKRYAIVASGDLSHVLKADGPYGYDPAGPVLDDKIVAAVRRHDTQALLAIDPKILEAGAECGLRSILFLFGALEGLKAETQVLSYEGPFGVGYLVATFQPSLIDETEITSLARNAIKHYLESGETLEASTATLIGSNRPTGVFVSIHERNGDLRGCIGTIVATKSSLSAEIIASAISAATQDPRFPPLSLEELTNVHISVDILSTPVPATNPAHLNPASDGIIITTSDGHQGLLLPDIEGVDTVDQQIQICREKAGIDAGEPIEMATFKVARYREPSS